jgi:hypothetical protein
MTLPTPQERPTLPIWPTLGEVFSRSRASIQELARRAESGDPAALPVRVFRVGGRYHMSTAELRQVLGLDPGNANGGPSQAAAAIVPQPAAEQSRGSRGS